MKNYSKRLIGLLLSASLMIFIVACAKSGSGDGKAADAGTAGRYVEEDVSPPIDGWFMSLTDQNGAIICYDAGLRTRYISNDSGASWSSSSGPGANTERYATVRDAALMPDGSLLAQLQGEGLTIIRPDGSSDHYPVPEIDRAVADGNSFMISLLKVLGNDRLLIDFNVGGMVIQDGRPIGAAPVGGTSLGRAPIGGNGTQVNPDGAVPADGSSGGSPVMPGGEGEMISQDAPQTQDASSVQGAVPQRPGGTTTSGNTTSGSSSAFSMDSMSRQTSLYELSSGRFIATLPVESALAAAYDNEYVYLMDGRGYVNAYKLSDGSPSGKPAVNLSGAASASASSTRGPGMLIMPGMGGGVLAASGDGNLYALYDGNMLLCTAGGGVDTLLEGTAYSLGAPNSSAAAVFSLADGTLIVSMLENMDSNRLYRYRLDENATVNPDKTLTVWSLEDNSFVRAAIAELRRANPDSYIKYEVALSGDTAVSASDAIKTLNTRLLSGNGPDVLILDGCPIESYAGKGMLMDLAGLIDTNDMYANLLAPYVSDNIMFCLPAQFIMPALLGSEESIGKALTLSELVSTVVNGNDSSVMRPGSGGSGPFSGVPEDERAELYFDDVEELCNIMWLSCAPAVVDGNRLDTDELRAYLEAVKAISDKYNLAAPDSENGPGLGVAFASGGRATALPSSLVRYTSQITNYGAFFADNITIMQLTMNRGASLNSHIAPFPGLAPGAWRPTTVTGVSADSKVADFAVELVKSMLSLDVQRINYGEGLPVTRAGVAAQLKELNDRLEDSGLGTFTIDMDSLISRLITPSAEDSVLMGMIQASVDKLCLGKLDVEGAVKEIEQNVKNYLAERA